MEKLKISLAGASKLRKEAAKAGYLEFTRDYEQLPYDPPNVNLLRKYSEKGNRIRIVKDKIYMERPSLIWSNINIYMIRPQCNI